MFMSLSHSNEFCLLHKVYSRSSLSNILIYYFRQFLKIKNVRNSITVSQCFLMYLVSSTSNDVIVKCFLPLYLTPLTPPPIIMKQKINRLKLTLEIQLPLGLILQKVFEIYTYYCFGTLW